jgi:hypothetical protein
MAPPAVVWLGVRMQFHRESAVPKSSLGSEFDAFLFAPLGEDRNGLQVSVISLLARMNLDPWQEAGDLAILPAEAAAGRLAVTLDTLTDPKLRQANSRTMALSLLALLPHRTPVDVQVPRAAIAAATPPDFRARIGAAIIIMSAIMLLGSQLITARRSAPIPPGGDHGSAVLTAPSPALPTHSTQH